MSDLAIRVENLGKRYRLKHQNGRVRYRTLRDDLVNLPERVWRAFRSRRHLARDDFWALREVSFDVCVGEVLGVIGRNGAGKSTLLKILGRIVSPTTGTVDLYGRLGSLLEVGTGFHPELTGRENIYLSGAMLGLRRREIGKRFDEIVAFAEVEKFIDTACKHYSSGMYTRLGFAVAANLDAEILLVDEVLAVGDASFRQKCLGKMSAVAQSGRTVLLVSHDLNAIMQLAQRCLWIEKGRVAQLAKTGPVIGAYLAAFADRGESGGVGIANFQRESRSIWFSSASLSGDNGPGMVSMGETSALTFEINAGGGSETRAVRIVVAMRTEEGVPIALMADIDSGFELYGGVGKKCRITVKFTDIRLYPGRYFLRLWVGSPDALETFDDRPDCLMLTVLDGGKVSQRRLLRSQGIFFIQPEWAIVSNSLEV